MFSHSTRVAHGEVYRYFALDPCDAGGGLPIFRTRPVRRRGRFTDISHSTRVGGGVASITHEEVYWDLRTRLA